MRYSFRRLNTFGCVIAYAVASTTPAFAQVTTNAPKGAAVATQDGVEDIIVTAERREQNLQRAPITIQVLSGEEVVKRGVATATDLGKLTTGLEIGAGGTSTQFFIRGVGAFAFSPLSTPGVAFNVDGVYVGRPNGVNGNFYDVARIEILKGPQGTLYGRNANGGSVNLVTNAPRIGQRTLALNTEVGNYDLIHTSGAVNLPLGANAAIRAAFNIVNREGYLSNGANDEVSQSARLRLKWEPNADVSLLLNADYTHAGGRGSDYVYLPKRPGASPYEAPSTPEANAYLRSFMPFGPLLADIRDNGFQSTKLYNLSAELGWRLGNLATLTILPAYRHMNSSYITHFGQDIGANELTRQSSLETRLGNSTKALTWVVGAYLYDEDSPHTNTTAYAGNILQNNALIYNSRTKAYAGFGQATVSIFDQLRVIAGIRYTNEKRIVSGSITDVAPTPPRLVENFGGHRSFSGTSYRVGVEYDLSPKNLIFLTYSTGFKSGGLTQTISPVNVFRPERLKSLEFGSKNRFFDNHLQLNVGAFHWKYTDIQDQRVSFDPLGNVNFLTFNSGDATIYGGNIDIVARPTRADTISLSGEYTRSRYDRFFYQTPEAFYIGSSGCRQSGPYAPGAKLPYTQSYGSNTNDGVGNVLVFDCSKFQVARVPKWSGTLAVQHEFGLASGAVITADTSVKYSSGRWLSIDFNPAQRDGAYAVLDANVTYGAPDGSYSLGLFARNLTKTVYYTGGLQATFVGLFAANIAPPRTYGLRASVNFGNH